MAEEEKNTIHGTKTSWKGLYFSLHTSHYIYITSISEL